MNEPIMVNKTESDISFSQDSAGQHKLRPAGSSLPPTPRTWPQSQHCRGSTASLGSMPGYSYKENRLFGQYTASNGKTDAELNVRSQ